MVRRSFVWLLVGLLGFTGYVLFRRAARPTQRIFTLNASRFAFTPAVLRVNAGEPFTLVLQAEDGVHGFAIGQSEAVDVDLYPGQPVRLDLKFDQPGTYTFYCTRWCGADHWRMRGVIVVAGESAASPTPPEPPLFVTLGLDIDAPHPAAVQPEGGRPSPRRGARLAHLLPDEYRSRAYYESHSPAEAWLALRVESALAAEDDAALWDLVAYLWQQAIPPESLAEGAELYSRNCAACHGVQGRGDGLFAATPTSEGFSAVTAPPDLGDPAFALGASPALWQGKIVRGGMGTGMPSWGAIFTPEQSWALTDYLWTFSLIPTETRSNP